MKSDSSPTLAASKLRKRRESEHCRRRFTRQTCKERPRVRLVSAGRRPYEAVIRDLSTEGIGLLVAGSFAIGAVVTIQFASTTSKRQRGIPAQVRHARQQPDGSWLIGLRLTRAFTEDEIAALLPGFSGSAAADRFRRGETVVL